MQTADARLRLRPLLLLYGCDAAGPVETANGVDAVASGNPPAVAEPAAASLPDPPPDPARDEAELIRLEREYARALVEKDRDFLMRFYASDWRGGRSDQLLAPDRHRG